MPSRLPRLPVLPILIASLALAGAAARALDAPAPDTPPLVYAADVDGIIQPITAEFMVDAISEADQHDAALLVFTLRTPGGLLDSTREIVDRMLSARTPVAVFIGPAGARAASAGFIITMASDLAVMARGSHLGAAHPVNLGSGSTEKPDATMAKKAAEDVSAWVRSLASARGRNVSMAAEAVTESKAFTEREALDATPPLVELEAADLGDLLRKVDGRTLTRFDGRSVVLRTAGARIERLDMSWRQRFLSAIAHPQVAYLLFMLGTLGLTIELWNPGAILPGVAGGLCLLLAFFAFQVLPVNAAGLLLILFGVALLIVEIKVPSFGVLGLGGVASLVFGSLMLSKGMPGQAPGLDLILPVALAVAAVLLFLGRLAVASQRRHATTGTAGMLGLEGRAMGRLEPADTGQVSVRGEIWSATSRVAVPEGGAVRVIAIHGLVLDVEPLPVPSEGASS
jgi:membrane-bound serine protease (ClpP class)